MSFTDQVSKMINENCLSYIENLEKNSSGNSSSSSK